MEGLAGVEKIIAMIGAVVVFVFAIIGLRGEWKKTGLDDQVTKLLLGLMAFGCLLVLLAAFGVLPRGGAA
jgi:NADH:ubiquinone oxidoreductase subunit 6 (subunit J)